MRVELKGNGTAEVPSLLGLRCASFLCAQERVKKMTPQQRAKYREKQEKLQMKRMSKTRMMKM